MIVAVADAARRLVRAGRLGDGFDMMAHSILSVRSQLVLFGQSGMGLGPIGDSALGGKSWAERSIGSVPGQRITPTA